jgi:uncharacterized membrane protein
MTFTLVCITIGLAAALVAGVFQSFSDFVMRGLVAAAPASGMESMQHINRTVFRSVFLTLFFLLVPATIAAAMYSQFTIGGAVAQLITLGMIIYVSSVFCVTLWGNVPMNTHLDRLTLDDPKAQGYWAHYAKRWTLWNHVRTLGSLATATCFILAATQF